ncbi:putative membrane protein [Variovorax soli]|uniref:Membrane protein n=2 Tax=Variovorax soli TaxID=376815 RepID=A0ABU1NBW0_9BURK|nr:putative membrane protein [Variovorax soli]
MALLLLAGVGYAGVSHWMMLFHAAEPWAVGVLLGPLWLTALGIAGSRFGSWGLAIAALAGVLGFALVLRGDAGDPNRLYMLQHAGINALLCGWFGGTLRRDRLSLIGQFAARIHPLSPAMRDYTCRVTWVWTVYFALMVLASVIVYATMSFAAWSVLANLLTPLMVGILFVGEYLLRYRLHPEFERTRLIDAVRAFYNAPADPAPRP